MIICYIIYYYCYGLPLHGSIYSEIIIKYNKMIIKCYNKNYNINVTTLA